MSVVWAPYSQLRPCYRRPADDRRGAARRAQQNPSMNTAIHLARSRAPEYLCVVAPEVRMRAHACREAIWLHGCQVVAPEPTRSFDKMQNSLPSGSPSVIQSLARRQIHHTVRPCSSGCGQGIGRIVVASASTSMTFPRPAATPASLTASSCPAGSCSAPEPPPADADMTKVGTQAAGVLRGA